MEKVTNYIEITSNPKLKMSLDGDFFKVWAVFLRPIHDLTRKETEVLAACLKERYRISKKIPDAKMVDSILFSKDTRNIICKQCNIKPKHLNVILSKFRKNGVIKNGSLFIRLIPTTDKDGARLLINFKFKNEQQFIKLGPQENRKRD